MSIVTLHATCVEIGRDAVLLMGDSGMGKSDLALRLIDRGARLVSDDYVDIILETGVLIAQAPQRLEGLLEVRGVGILTLPYTQRAVPALALTLAHRDEVERLPHPELFDLLGIKIPQLRLHAFDASTPLKIEHCLRAIRDNSLIVGVLKD